MTVFNDVFGPSGGLFREQFPHDKPWHLNFSLGKNAPNLVHNAFTSHKGILSTNTTMNLKFPFGTGSVMMNPKSMKTNFFLQPNVLPFSRFSAIVEKSFDQDKALVDNMDLTAEINLPSNQHIMNPKFKITGNPYRKSGTASAVVSIPISETTVGRAAAEFSSNFLDNSNNNYKLGLFFSHQMTAQNLFTVGTVVSKMNSLSIGKFNGFVHCKQGQCTSGAELCHNVETGKTNLSLIVSYPIPLNDALKNKSLIKTKFTEDGKISVALTHEIHEKINATLSTQLDTKTNATEYGIKFDVVL